MDVCLGRDECLQLDHLVRHEWLESNGRGGYAASTAGQCHTRKYHGLLVLPLSDPPGKFVLLSKLEASIGIADDWYELGTNYYPSVVHPHGWQHLVQVSHELWLTETFEVGGCELRRDTLMPRGDEAVMQRFSLIGAPGLVTLRLTPLLAYRQNHALTQANPHLWPTVLVADNQITMRPYPSLPPLIMEASQPWQFETAPCWYYGVQYPGEQQRGLAFQEDLFQPGILTVTLHQGDILVVRAGIAPASEPLRKTCSNAASSITSPREVFSSTAPAFI